MSRLHNGRKGKEKNKMKRKEKKKKKRRKKENSKEKWKNINIYTAKLYEDYVIVLSKANALLLNFKKRTK